MSGYFYIGSTKNLRKRKTSHLRLLNSETHFNRFMQNVYNKYKNTYNLRIIKICDCDEDMKNLEEFFINDYKEKYNKKCMNILTVYGGGSNWRSKKTKEELKEINAKCAVKPENRETRNRNHKNTLKNTPDHIIKDRHTRATKSRALNIKNRKNYTPIDIKILYPDGTEEYRSYDTETEFFSDTLLEDNSLRTIKRGEVKIIKKILNFTKHSFPVGTTITRIQN